MLFNSFAFAVFLTITFCIYWLFNNRKFLQIQNIVILVASYAFYAFWDWRFLLLIIASTLTDYLIGLSIPNATNQRNRKILLSVSIFVNIGLLVLFKYFGFFVESFVSLVEFLGITMNTTTMQFLLPVGISFYTLQTLSYTIDIYRGTISPTRNAIAFFAFVSFFPQLVAGPIERAKNLLPQFLSPRTFTYKDATRGVKQILWGLFKKIAVADVLATHVEAIFSQPSEMSTGVLLLGAIFFAFQVYADFSGYSDIAIGIARLLGFRLMVNFNYPFFSRDIAEFWRKWHISLTTWFRDYVYVSLGGSRVGLYKKIRNVFVIFIVSGLWHGAAMTYILWGVLSAITFLPLMIGKKDRVHTKDNDEENNTFFVREFFQIVGTFFMFAIPLIMFRSESVMLAFSYYAHLFLNFGVAGMLEYVKVTYVIFILVIVEWFGRRQEFPIMNIPTNRFVRFLVYFLLFYFTIAHVSNEANQFIYFQF